MIAPLPPQVQACLAAIESENPAGFRACFAPQARFFGTWISTEIQGLDYIQWAFRAALEVMPGLRVVPLETHGDDVELGVSAQMILRDGRTTEGLWVFKLDAEGRIDRLAVLWDPATLLPGHDSTPTLPTVLPDAVRAPLEAALEAFNHGDEERLVALLSPTGRYRGTLGKVETQGRAAARGVFRGIRYATGLDQVMAGRVVGRMPEVAFKVSMGISFTGASTEGWWVLRFTEGGAIQRMAVLWNPLQLLSRRRSSVS
ncbi:MAG TPA: nuclear transport factor 2 family protein [Holophagaceae bacterium]|nr:nuclear transport factor 2 family protein [Holophagaceae bacterium]